MKETRALIPNALKYGNNLGMRLFLMKRRGCLNRGEKKSKSVFEEVRRKDKKKLLV